MDVEKTIEFILENQAQAVVRMDRMDAEIQALAGVVKEQQRQITTILGAIAMLTEQVSRLTQRVDALAHMFEEWLRRSGDGSGRS